MTCVSGRKPRSVVAASSLTVRSLVKKRAPLWRKASRRSAAASGMPPASKRATLSSARLADSGSCDPRPKRPISLSAVARGRGGPARCAGERQEVGGQAVDPGVDAELLGLQRDAAHDVAPPGDERAVLALDLVVAVAEAHGDPPHALAAAEQAALALHLDLALQRALQACGERLEERRRVARVGAQRRGEQIEIRRLLHGWNGTRRGPRAATLRRHGGRDRLGMGRALRLARRARPPG